MASTAITVGLEKIAEGLQMATAKSQLLSDRRTAVYAGGTSRWSFAQFVDILLAWHERSRQRRRLLSLGNHLLKDIGMSRTDAKREAGKPFWERKQRACERTRL